MGKKKKKVHCLQDKRLNPGRKKLGSSALFFGTETKPNATLDGTSKKMQSKEKGYLNFII